MSLADYKYHSSERVSLLMGDALEVLRALPAGIAQTVVTSPPYWGLRDYETASWDGGDPECKHRQTTRPRSERPLGKLHGGVSTIDAADGGTLAYRDECKKCGATRVDKQIGLEQTPEAYVASLVEVFREARRVLRDDGTVWLNVGDSYSSGSRTSTTVQSLRGREDGPQSTAQHPPPVTGIKPKDLVGIPWMLAFALRADGWYLRSDIIWAKPNPMPESVTDRPTKAHEYLFLLSKRERYYYDADAIREAVDLDYLRRRWGGTLERVGDNGLDTVERSQSIGKSFQAGVNPNGRNKRTVWTIVTVPMPEEHFACFPPELAKTCILAGTSEKGACPECGAPWERVVEKLPAPHEAETESAYAQMHNSNGHRLTLARQAQRAQGHEPVFGAETVGWQSTCSHEFTEDELKPCVVLDPFVGAGTAVLTAKALGRRGIGIDLSEKYLDMAKRRDVLESGWRLRKRGKRR